MVAVVAIVVVVVVVRGVACCCDCSGFVAVVAVTMRYKCEHVVAM